ncbi:MAG TPA: hypothetical protein GXX36_11720 [Clostridiaceae bacterium]|nr:hypothetical protein [Clostridiaceae bacterium]
MKKFKLIRILGIFLVISFTLILQESTSIAVSKMEFNDGPGDYYNYCPSYIQASPTERYMFYCKNKDSGSVVDYIYYRKATYSGGKWNWGNQNIALAPSGSGWDSVHVCDPDVKQGSFTYNGHTYSYVMFYLGTDQYDNCHNQIGVAFADSLDGPWVKYSGNPLIPYSDRTTWGVGQASATCVDGVGRMLLFYTKGTSWTDPNQTYICRREINIANMSNPSIGTEYRVFENGLTDKTPNSFCFHNAAFAYDGATDRFYMVRDRGIEENVLPDFVSSEIQVAYTSGSNIWSNSGTWTVEGMLSCDQTGHARNHNACLLTDTWGGLVGGANGYTIAYTSSDTGSNWLWSYRIFTSPKSDLSLVTKIDGQNKAVTYSGAWNDYFDSNLNTWYMGTDKWTSSPGAYFECSFRGTNIYYYGSKASDNGKADIYIDGVYQATIDTYSPTFLKSVLLWSKTGLSPGNHTIKVVIRNDKNQLSTGYNKDLDYLMILP